MSTTPKKATVKTDLLLRHPFLQMRHLGTQEAHSRDMAEAIKRKEKVPPIKAVQCSHPETPDLVGIYVTDGFHTLAGHEANGSKTVPVLLSKGTWDDAVLAAAAANASHNSLKRTRDDKRKAVKHMLEQFPKWSATRIADHVKVSKDLVSEMKDELRPAEEEAEEEVVEDKRGTNRKVKVKKNADKKRGKKAAGKAKPAADWRYVELKEFVTAEQYVWDALAEAGIYQAHQFMRAMADGTKIGLDKAIIDQLMKEVEGIIPEGEATLADAEAGTTGTEGQGGLVFDWQRFYAASGVVIRSIDGLYKNHEQAGTAEHKAMKTAFGKLLGDFKKEFKRVTGKDAPQQ